MENLSFLFVSYFLVVLQNPSNNNILAHVPLLSVPGDD